MWLQIYNILKNPYLKYLNNSVCKVMNLIFIYKNNDTDNIKVAI